MDFNEGITSGLSTSNCDVTVLLRGNQWTGLFARFVMDFNID
jgi:hypothetical protein